MKSSNNSKQKLLRIDNDFSYTARMLKRGKKLRSSMPKISKIASQRASTNKLKRAASSQKLCFSKNLFGAILSENDKNHGSRASRQEMAKIEGLEDASRSNNAFKSLKEHYLNPTKASTTIQFNQTSSHQFYIKKRNKNFSSHRERREAVEMSPLFKAKSRTSKGNFSKTFAHKFYTSKQKLNTVTENISQGGMSPREMQSGLKKTKNRKHHKMWSVGFSSRIYDGSTKEATDIVMRANPLITSLAEDPLKRSKASFTRKADQSPPMTHNYDTTTSPTFTSLCANIKRDSETQKDKIKRRLTKTSKNNRILRSKSHGINKLLDTNKELPAEKINIISSRNASYLLERPVKITKKKMTIMEKLTATDKPRRTVESLQELRMILDNQTFPKLKNRIFEPLNKLILDTLQEMDREERSPIKRQQTSTTKHLSNPSSFQKSTNPLEADPTSLTKKIRPFRLNPREKVCKFMDRPFPDQCYERDSSKMILEWLSNMLEKYDYKNSDEQEIRDYEEFLVSRQQILAYSMYEFIEVEKKRCKESSQLLDKFYRESLILMHKFIEYFNHNINTTIKRNRKLIKGVRDECDEKLRFYAFEHKQLTEKLEAVKGDNYSNKFKNRLLRSKLNNDYLVIKNLKDDLEYQKECIRVLKQENFKIADMFQEMIIDIKGMNGTEQLRRKLMEMQRLHGLYQSELETMKGFKEKADQEKSKREMSERDKIKFKNSMSKVVEDDSFEDFDTREFGIQTGIKASFFMVEKETQCEVTVQTLATQTGEDDEVQESALMLIARQQQIEKEAAALAAKGFEGCQGCIQKNKEISILINRIRELKEQVVDDSRNQSFVSQNSLPLTTGNTFLLNIPISEEDEGPDPLGSGRTSKTRLLSKRNTIAASLSPISSKSRFIGKGMDTEFGYDSDEESVGSKTSKLSALPENYSLDVIAKQGIKAVRIVHKKLLKRMATIISNESKEAKKIKSTLDEYETYMRNRQQIKRRKSRMRSSGNKRRKGAYFRFNKKGLIENQTRKKNNEMMSLANTLFNEAMLRLKRNFPIKSSVLIRDITLVKELAKIYADYEANKAKRKGMRFMIQTFKCLRNKISNKKILLKKFKYLIYSINHNIKIPSVKLFAKFLGIGGGLDLGCLDTYLALATILRKRNNIDIYKRKSTRLMINWTTFGTLVNYYYIKIHQAEPKDPSIKEEIINNARPFMEKNKKNVSVIDFDQGMEVLLEEHSLHSRDPITVFFETADLNGDGSLDYGEFVRITRHVEHKFYIKHKDSGLRNIFESYAEVPEDCKDEDEEDKVITPLAFKKMCRLYEIYGIEAQESFLEEMSNKGLARSIEELTRRWSVGVKDKIMLSLVGCKNPELKIFAESLDGFIINFDEKKSHTIWLNYKILEAEIERISAQKKIQDHLPSQLSILDKIYMKEIDDQV